MKGIGGFELALILLAGACAWWLLRRHPLAGAPDDWRVSEEWLRDHHRGHVYGAHREVERPEPNGQVLRWAPPRRDRFTRAVGE